MSPPPWVARRRRWPAAGGALGAAGLALAAFVSIAANGGLAACAVLVAVTVGTGLVLALAAVLTPPLAEAEAPAPRAEGLDRLAHRERLALLGEMTAGFAHEVNQRLAAIAGYRAACVRAAGDRPEALRLLDKIEVQTMRAAELVARAGDLSRSAACRELLDVPDLVAAALDWITDEAMRQGVVLGAVPIGAPLPRVWADRRQVEQVLLNLLRNALDALRPAAGPKRITLLARAAEDGSGVVVAVRDTGCGVPPAIAPQLFAPFFTTKPAGVGLGLSISRSIIEAHGGRLWHAATEAGGAEFAFFLPSNGEPGDAAG